MLMCFPYMCDDSKTHIIDWSSLDNGEKSFNQNISLHSYNDVTFIVVLINSSFAVNILVTFVAFPKVWLKYRTSLTWTQNNQSKKKKNSNEQRHVLYDVSKVQNPWQLDF